MDDVLLKSGECSNILNCDFETSCTWSNVKDKRIVKFQWQIEQGINIPVGYYGEYMGPTVDSLGSNKGEQNNDY